VRSICRSLLLVLALTGAVLFADHAQGQDEPSLGDVARQTRQQKQKNDLPAKDGQSGSSQNKDIQSKDVPNKGTQSTGPLSKSAPGKDAQLHRASHVITDDELPQHPVAGVKIPASPTGKEFAPDPAFGGKMSPDEVRSQIQDQKSAISALEAQITGLNDSIHFAGANCVANCVQWNESQQQKQRQVEDMRSELENAKQALEQMQDYARKMGFGSSVSDPEP
jgi:hypothetical protein